VAAHSHAQSNETDVTRLRPGNKTLGIGLMAVGAVLLVGAAVITGLHDAQRFFFAYLFGVAGFLIISCSALVFTLISHLVRAGWIISVRRVLDTISAQLPLMSLLLIPVIATALYTSNKAPGVKPLLYSWAMPANTPIVEEESEGEEHPAAGEVKAGPVQTEEAHHPEAAAATSEHHADKEHADATYGPTTPNQPYPNEQVRPGVQRGYDELIHSKAHGWLNPTFWTLRVVFYLIVLSGIAWFFYNRTIVQDRTGDIDISETLMSTSGPLLMATGTVFTLLAFDVFMTLDPHWFSTMYGVYFFASGTQAMWSVMALSFLILQARGYLRRSVSTEHLHDIGKYMFAFVVFFAYIAFSQYMLQWYANLPEETFFFDKRGYSTAHPNGYSPLVFVLLIGRFCIPFIGLVSRHVKRNRFGLGFWAVWLLVCFFVDVYLLVMPDYRYAHKVSELPFALPEILCLLGAGSLWLGNIIRTLANHELRPIRDPRAHESLAYVNAY
jgi:hypothetical protein